MKKDQIAFLIAGFAFGILVGYGLFHALDSRPRFDAAAGPQVAVAQPAGPPAPGQVGPAGAAGGAPMMAEINGLKRRLQNDPEDIASVVRLANIYHDVGMWEQAIGFYGRALEIRPGDPDLMTDLGICYRGTGQFDRALELFDQAAALDSAHWQSLFNTVIVAAFDVAQFERAERALASMEAMTPPPPRLAELRQAVERARDEAAGETQS